MNLADFFAARWLSLEIPYELFDGLRLRCRSCHHRLRDHGDYQILQATRLELIGRGARVVYFPPHAARARKRWCLLLPLSTVNLALVQHHLFHEIEHEWDHRFLGLEPVHVATEDDWDPDFGKRPVSVDDLAGGRIRTLPLTPWGPLPIEDWGGTS